MDEDYSGRVGPEDARQRLGLPWGSRDPLRDPKPLIRRVYSYVAYWIGEGADAEDVTSSVFERAVRYRTSYDARKGDPTAWVLGIARRALAEHMGRPVPVPVPDADLDRAESGPEEATLRRMTLEEALAALPDRDRDLLSLRYGADLKAREIAAVLGVSAHAAEVALARASTRLRQLLIDAGV